MIDGIYSITFRGAADWGIGLLILQNGVITGVDVGGVQYDGVFSEEASSIKIDLTLTVPPGVSLVQGTPAQPTEFTVSISDSLPVSALDSNQPVTLKMPIGPVNVIFQRLRVLSN